MTEPAGTASPSKSQRAYQLLHDRIVDGTYSPGYRLVLDAIGRELDMSVVPVREAIRRLEAEGLVTFERNIGARVAEITYRLDHGSGRYRIETTAQATGLVALVYSGQLTQTSEGSLGGGGLLPEHYAEKRGRRPERSIRFDRSRSLMIGIGDVREVPLPPGTQDRLSLGYQLGLVARGAPRLVSAGQVKPVDLGSGPRFRRKDLDALVERLKPARRPPRRQPAAP